MQSGRIFDDLTHADIDPELNHFSELYPDIHSSIISKYYSIEAFNKIDSKSSNDLAVIHVNVRSLFNKLDHFQALLDLLAVKFDIICFSECWLNESNKDLVCLDGYNVFHSLRPNRIGGGVSVFVNNMFKSSIIESCTKSTTVIETFFRHIL